ncbi:MAG: DUF4845 domain-containing protein [Burkholderiales bacterium]
MKNQRGLSMWEILVLCIVIVMLAIGGLKVAPAYIEYFKVKKAVTGIVQSGEARGTVNDIRRAFDRRAAIDDIDIIKPQDLEITKEGNEVVISFSYPKKVPLFGNLSLWFDFTGSSNN